MKVNVIIFGQLTDITGSSAITINDVRDTDQLVMQLHNRFPAMAELSYIIAVEKEIITSNTALNNNYTVALLPPYAGG
ncbi:MAG: MoaD/ThiS family protein [Bacteroidota bacterium]